MRVSEDRALFCFQSEQGPFTLRSTLHKIKRSVPAVFARLVSDSLTYADNPRTNHFKRPQFMYFLPAHTAGKQGRVYFDV